MLAFLDDVAFLLRVIEVTAAAIPSVDTRRVYVTGLGDGCNMAQHLALRASGHLAAVGCFSGVLHQSAASITADDLQRFSPLPVFLTFSEERPVNGARESFETWASLNQCTGASQNTLRAMADVTRERYADCRGGLEVSFTSLAARSGAALASTIGLDEAAAFRRAVYSAAVNPDYHPVERTYEFLSRWERVGRSGADAGQVQLRPEPQDPWARWGGAAG